MNQEARQCQNCRKEFVIESEDFDFYKKIEVPPPTFCPRCRLQRRLATIDFHRLYKRICDLCGEVKLSEYAPDAQYVVYCPECWWSDKWDPFAYGRNYDFSRPFFEQFNEMLHTVPLIGLSVNASTLENSSYINHAGYAKNCYLIFDADFNENCAYGSILKKNRSLIDCSCSLSCELCYDQLNGFKNNRCIGSENVTESLDCAFLRDSDNCQDCFLSANLKNKKYYILNKPYTKEEYIAERNKWDLGSRRTYEKAKALAESHWRKYPPKVHFDEMSQNCTGSFYFESKNCKECFDVNGAQDSKYLLLQALGPIRDAYDVSSWGNNLNLVYECSAVGENIARVKFCQTAGINMHDVEYCKDTFGGANKFGCVSVKKGDYCIMNRQYAPAEYQRLRSKIIDQMDERPYTDKQGNVYRYGEFFPIAMSAFPYNDTMAQNFFPISESEAIQSGYRWRREEKADHGITKDAKDLPDHIRDTDESILNEVVGCAECGRGFKIIRMEYQFLKAMNLPLPRECPFCRIGEKFDRWVGKMRILERSCAVCGAKVQTYYSAEDAPRIFCKSCWLKEFV